MSKSSMTNGDVAAANSQDGVRHLVVTYNGGKQDVRRSPTAPIVDFQPGSRALLAKGADVFIKATNTDSGLDANAAAVGVGG